MKIPDTAVPNASTDQVWAEGPAVGIAAGGR